MQLPSLRSDRRLLRRAAGLGLLAAALALPASASPADATLRVGTSGDYEPFSFASPGEAAGRLIGFDLAVARLYAADRGFALELVRFRWPELLRDLAAGRFDLAMSGVTVRPERSLVGRFSAPVAESGAVALVRDPRRFRQIDDLDHPSVRLVTRMPANRHVTKSGRLNAKAARSSLRAKPRPTLTAITKMLLSMYWYWMGVSSRSWGTPTVNSGSSLGESW